MNEPTVVDVPCAYDDCEMPVEMYDARFFHSDPGPHTYVMFYRCLAGHRFLEEGEAEEVTE